MYTFLIILIIFLSISLSYTWGFLSGYAYKVYKNTKDPSVKEVLSELEEDVLKVKPTGDIIQINQVENYLKENADKTISLGEIIDIN